jgi:hypothetical protein
VGAENNRVVVFERGERLVMSVEEKGRLVSQGEY